MNTTLKQLVCKASSHQGDNDRFFHYPGQQCAGIAFTSLLYSTICPVGSWIESDLDKLLIVGDRLHFFQVCHLRYKVGVTQKLHVDELPTKLRAFSYEFHIDREIFGGTTRQKKGKLEDQDILVLPRVFEECVQQNYVGIVLRFQDYCVSCINSYGEWFLFDSHARNKEGMVDGNGKAVLLKFSNSAAIANHVNDFVGTNDETDTSFEALALTKIQRKSCANQAEMRINFVPSFVLTRFKSKYGNVQVNSDNLQNLELGFLIDDNIIDFVLFYKAEERSYGENFSADKLYIFSSCFYKKLTDFNPNRIRNWTRGINIFSKEFVVIPVCTGIHWLLVIVKMNYGDGVSIMILDSANRSSSRAGVRPRPSVERTVRTYLQDEWVAKAQNKGREISFVQVKYPDVPQQPNDTDCGAYVMKFFTEFIGDLPVDQWPSWKPRFTDDDVKQLRTNTMFVLQDLASGERDD